MDSHQLVGVLGGAGVLLCFVGLVVHLAYACWQTRMRTNVGVFADSGGLRINTATLPESGGNLVEKMNTRLRKLNVIPKLKLQLLAAGIGMAPVRFLLIQIILSLAGAVVGLSLAPPTYGLVKLVSMGVGAFLGYNLVRPYLALRRKRRLKAFEAQLPNAIDVLAGALEAGSSLPQSMAMAAREMDDPMSTELSRVVLDQELGLSQQDALARMLERCPSDVLDMLITSIGIQYRVGGNLAKVLRSISNTIRERLRIKQEIQVLTAQGRISTYVITAIPIGLGGLIFMMNPEFMMPLFTTGMGQKMVAVSIVMMCLGYYTMMRIIAIKV